MTYLVTGGVILLELILVITVAVFLARAEKTSEGKQALVVIGAALVLVVVMGALFGTFYEPSF